MSVRREAERWMEDGSVPGELKAELAALLGDEGALEERFAVPLRFGTAGLRGIMGAGIGRINLLTVRHATQAMAELILARDGAAGGCAVCYDTRSRSSDFARAAAEVLAANGIRVLLFDHAAPTPELSFAIRHHGCAAGINITASHNPPAYNGYKVYWNDGAQMPPELAAQVAERMERLDVLTGAKRMTLEEAEAAELVARLGEETDREYRSAVLAQSVLRPEDRQALEDLRVVYTPLHGTGAGIVPETLRQLGVRGENLWLVEEQMTPDGAFSTVRSPNPEEADSFTLALELARKVEADLILATDPDADRVGAMVRCGGEYRSISGNAMGALLCDYVLTARAPLPENALVLKSLVSTELARAVAEAHGAACEDTFTGFKFIAERMARYERTGEKQVLFSFEESYGYLPGTYVRDKDSVSASMLIAEMTAHHLARGKTLPEVLEQLGDRCGHYAERTVNIARPGPGGAAEMQRALCALRSGPPETLAGRRVVRVLDYLTGTARSLRDGAETPLAMSGSDVLELELEDGCRVLIRPSGTEPKMKVYLLCRGATAALCRRAVEELSGDLPV